MSVPSPSGQPGCRARRQGRCAPPAAGPRTWLVGRSASSRGSA